MYHSSSLHNLRNSASQKYPIQRSSSQELNPQYRFGKNTTIALPPTPREYSQPPSRGEESSNKTWKEVLNIDELTLNLSDAAQWLNWPSQSDSSSLEPKVNTPFQLPASQSKEEASSFNLLKPTAGSFSSTSTFNPSHTTFKP